MRPKERLLRRGRLTPNDENAIRIALEAWSDSLSHWAEVFTATVVLGLVVEYLPDITYFLRFVLLTGFAVAVQKHSEQLRQLGGFLVIVGVAGELWIEIRASRVETDLREETNEVIARAQERAAEALKAAAEANLARAKLEQRMKPRMILGPKSDKLKELLVPHAGKWVDIMVFDQHVQETTNLAWQFLSLFRSAGWNVRMWEPIGNTHPIHGASLLVPIGLNAPIEFLELAIALSDRIRELDIECNVAPGSFGEVGTPFGLNGPFRLTKEDPLQIFGHKTVSPFRIQIGALQLVPVASARVVIARAGPQPQA